MASPTGFAFTGRHKRWCLKISKASSFWVSLWRSPALVGNQVIGTQWASEKLSDLHNSSFASTFTDAISASWNLNFDLPHADVSITASTHSSSASGWTLFLYSVNSKTAIRHCIFLLLITVLSKTLPISFFILVLLKKRLYCGTLTWHWSLLEKINTTKVRNIPLIQKAPEDTWRAIIWWIL